MADRPERKPLARLGGGIKTPPMSRQARVEAGTLLRRVQEGESIGMPHSRPMRSIGPRCHELCITDENRIWRIIYRIDSDAIVIAAVFSKTTRATPRNVIDECRNRLNRYGEATKRAKKGAGR